MQDFRELPADSHLNFLSFFVIFAVCCFSFIVILFKNIVYFLPIFVFVFFPSESLYYP